MVDLMEVLGADEELDPELAACIRETRTLGPFIKHKFVNSLYVPPMNGYFNKQLRYKQREVARAMAEGQWSTYIFLHERPWRFDALLEIADSVSDEMFWSLVRTVWMDSENIPEHQWEWDELLRTPRPGHQHMMEAEEVEALAELPAVIPVYQGHTDERDDGWSWTTQLQTAEWFAKRFRNLEDAAEAHVSYGTVNRDDVLAYFLGRGEAEILIDPDLVTHLKVVVLHGP